MGAAAEDLYASLLDPETLKDFIDLLTDLIDGIDTVVESFGGMKGMLFAIGTIASRVFSETIVSGISKGITNLIGY
jgi:hypothetical protein